MGLSTPAWERRYSRKLLTTDTLIVASSVFGAQFIRFGMGFTEAGFGVSLTSRTEFAVGYSLMSLALALGWLTILAIGDSRDPKIFGVGPVEYKRVVSLTFLTFGLFAIIAYILRAEIGRGYLLIAFPAGLLLLLISRWLWRKRLHRQRKRGKNLYRTLIIGDPYKCRHVATEISKDKNTGFELVGAVSDHRQSGNLLPNVPFVANYESLLAAVDELMVDTVVMTSSDAVDPDHLRQLGWELEARNIDLIVAAALTDVAGPRIHMRPVAGLPLIHVDYPKFVGRKRFAKRMFDVVGSGLLIILTSPLMLAVAIAVKTSSSGPIFYSQERVGLSGKPFRMFKFRSMVQGADDQLQSLLDEQGTSDKPLHKIQNDPRITPVGRFIRKYSLDELPQIFNVFIGTMSLVGPRPQRDSEVALYDRWHHRRLMVQPGITGLWQVSGRSDLDWEDAIRLDLYYVENWSVIGDIVLLIRTVKTVLKPEGAY